MYTYKTAFLEFTKEDLKLTPTSIAFTLRSSSANNRDNTFCTLTLRVTIIFNGDNSTSRCNDSPYHAISLIYRRIVRFQLHRSRTYGVVLKRQSTLQVKILTDVTRYNDVGFRSYQVIKNKQVNDEIKLYAHTLYPLNLPLTVLMTPYNKVVL